MHPPANLTLAPKKVVAVSSMIRPVSACSSSTNVVHDDVMVAGWLRNVGLRTSPHVSEIWESYGSLADANARTAFLHTLRSVIDQSGQRVSATTASTSRRTFRR